MSKTFMADNVSLLGKLFIVHLLAVGAEKKKNDKIAFFLFKRLQHYPDSRDVRVASFSVDRDINVFVLVAS